MKLTPAEDGIQALTRFGLNLCKTIGKVCDKINLILSSNYLRALALKIAYDNIHF